MHEFSIQQKREIAQYFLDNKNVKQVEVLQFLKKSPVEKSVRPPYLKYIVKKEYFASCDNPNEYRDRKPEYPELEEALFLYFSDLRAHHSTVNDLILTSKARFFGETYGLLPSWF